MHRSILTNLSRVGLRVGLALALGAAAAAVHAQAVRGNPLDQIPPAPLPAPAAPAATTLQVQPPAGAAEGKLDQRVTATRIDIEGVTALPFQNIAALFAGLVGKPMTVAQLVAVTKDATAQYRDSGRPLSFVYLPDQTFADGVVRVVAVEGFIASVRIEGDAGPDEALLRGMAQRLTDERPLTLASFERVTQLMSRLPGLTVSADASLPGTTDGATALVLKVTRKPYNVSVGADLRQPTARAVLTGVVNDPMVPGSQLSASTFLGDYAREKLLTVGYAQVVGFDGLVLKANFSSYRGYPDAQYRKGDSLERFNTNRRLDLSASYALLMSARSSVTLSGGFYGVDNMDRYTVPLSGAQLVQDTRVRALFAQLAYADNQPDRTRAANVLVAQGFDGAGALAENRSNVPGLSGRGNVSLGFTRLAVEASQRDRFANQWGTTITVGAQYSGQSLPSSEQTSFGGSRFARGYAPGAAAGDSGYGGGLELNRVFKLDGNWIKQVEPYLLVEAASVSTHAGTPSPEKLRSVALGVRVSDRKYYNVDVALAKPTGDASSDNPQRKLRLSLMLSYQLAAD
ncbi:ShlB/FhaC/HecB family hemolysin secretion/activation protein [soil metagenome]